MKNPLQSQSSRIFSGNFNIKITSQHRGFIYDVVGLAYIHTRTTNGYGLGDVGTEEGSAGKRNHVATDCSSMSLLQSINSIKRGNGTLMVKCSHQRGLSEARHCAYKHKEKRK